MSKVDRRERERDTMSEYAIEGREMSAGRTSSVESSERRDQEESNSYLGYDDRENEEKPEMVLANASRV